jgi:adenine-specific DNA-methyltransferase
MTTDPGDLMLDPTCGSGTSAFVAEQWGRRWIMADTSRVPLALARQRLLTATFRYYQLKDEVRGPAGGFLYARRQNRRGEEDGGIVPHITLKSIANDEPPNEEILVDRPEFDDKITRVAGPFCVEATIPMPVDWDGEGGAEEGGGAEDYGSYLDHMLDVLRRAPVLQLGGGQTVTLRNVRPPAKSLALSAEAVVEGDAAAGGSPPPQPSPIEGPIEGEGAKGQHSTIEGEGEKGWSSPIKGAHLCTHLLGLMRHFDSPYDWVLRLPRIV